MEEEWKDVKGYEGYYKVSNYGRVMSLNYQKRGYSQILKPKINNSGYEHYQLHKEGKFKDFLAHRLVADCFIPKEDGKDLINHKDENPRNNRVDNLEWCTNSYNVKYSYDLHPERKKRKGKSQKNKITERKNIKKEITRRKYNKKHTPSLKNTKHKRHGQHKPYKHNKALIQMDLNENIIAIHKALCVYCNEMNYRSSSIIECCSGKRKTAYGYKWKFAE